MTVYFFNLPPSLKPLLSCLKSRASTCLPYVILNLYSVNNELELKLVKNFPSEGISTRNIYKTNSAKKKILQKITF